MAKFYRATSFVLLVALIMVAVGCASKPEAPAKTEAPKEEVKEKPTKPVNLSFVQGATGGTWEMISNGIAETVRKSEPNIVVTVVPGSSIPNLERLSKGEYQLAYSFLTHVKAALAGEEPFKEKLSNLRVIATTHSTMAQFFVTTKLGINSFEELKAKKVPIRLGVHNKGTGVEEMNRDILKAHGISYEDIESWGGKIVFAGEKDALDLIRNGQIDGFGAGGAAPSSGLIDLSLTRDIGFLKMSTEGLNALVKEYGYVSTTVKKDAYKFLQEDHTTIEAAVAIVSTQDVPDDVIYRVVKAMVTNKETLLNLHKAVKDFLTTSPDAIIAGPRAVAPVHPGAEKYYREAGIIK
jgi:TRAP transporter TAXI family solute receptor